jgi:hypothetical protein
MLNPSKEQEEEWAYQRRLHFARYCWLNQYKTLNVRGEVLTWAQIFEKREGIPLHKYARERMDEREQQRQKGKRETRSTQEDQS